jgi:diguanylate cyclase (GGDEF)-like protein
MEEEVRRAFLDRPRLVENAPGFCGLSVLTDAKDPSVFLLLTRWADEGSFRSWHRSEAHHQSHELMPKGLKLDAAFTSLTIANSIEDRAGVQTLSDAIEGQTLALSQWLMNFDALIALLLAPDGTIRARNRTGNRLFPADPGKESTLWDFLVSDASELRRRLAEPDDQADGPLLMNLADGERNAITMEAGLVRCGGAVLLLGTEEHRHDSQYQAEIQELTNDLSMMIREGARQNRELKAANETIAQLARTDPLTGLANRRTLDECMQREIARASRTEENLSVIVADLDHFKSINDRFGHAIGDRVLAATAAVLAAGSRPFDTAARFGGEEFVLLLPRTSPGDAFGVAERIRKQIEQMEVSGCPAPVTVSLGVATWMDGEAPTGLIARADAALYGAKHGGRNRVEAAPPVPQESGAEGVRR